MLMPVTLSGNYLETDGRRFIPIGVNWVPARAAMLCAYPIEHILGAMPNAFEGGASVWRLYKALKCLAGIQSPFSVDQPDVEVGCLSGEGRDYVVLVNHTSGTVSGEVTAAGGDGRATHLLPRGGKSVMGEGNSWPFVLSGFTGALFEWRRA